MHSNGILRHQDTSPEPSNSVWNYGLNRSTDVPPPPGWNPPTASVDPWGNNTSKPQAKAANDLPDMELYDPWAESTALGIVDLLLKDNPEGAANGAAAKNTQAHPNMHTQNQAPKFAVPSIPPPDFHHWQAPTRAQKSRFDFAREEDDPASATNNAINGLITSAGINAVLPTPTSNINPLSNSGTGISNNGLHASSGLGVGGLFPLADPGIVAAKPASKASGTSATALLVIFDIDTYLQILKLKHDHLRESSPHPTLSHHFSPFHPRACYHSLLQMTGNEVSRHCFLT